MVPLRFVPLLQAAKDIPDSLVKDLPLLRQPWQRGQGLPIDGQSSLEFSLLHVEGAQLQVGRAAGLIMGTSISNRGPIQIGARLQNFNGLLAFSQRYE